MSKAWYVKQDEQVYGPYGIAKLKEMALDGHVSPDSMIGDSSDGPWNPANRIKGLQFAAPPPPRPQQKKTFVDDSASKDNPQTIELTAKKYKLIQIIGFLISLAGTIGIAISLNDESSERLGVHVLILVVGLGLFVIGRGLAWWHHG